MDKFARQSVQKYTPEPKFYRQKKPEFLSPDVELDNQTLPRRNKVDQSNQEKTNNQQTQSLESKILEQAYLDRFECPKAQILQNWLQMSKEDIASQCKIYNLPVSERQNQNVQSLFTFLNQFEQQALEQSQSKSEDQPQQNLVMEKFGKKKQEQIDAWLELNNTQLMSECQRFGLPQSTKHIQNIQTLFNFLKQIEAQKDQNEIEQSATPETNKESSDNDKNEIINKFSKQFQRNRERTFDINAQMRDAQLELEKDFGRIFERQKNFEISNQNTRALFMKQQPIELPVQQQLGPVAVLPWTKFTKENLLSSIKATVDQQKSKKEINEQPNKPINTQLNHQQQIQQPKVDQNEKQSNLLGSYDPEVNQIENEHRQNKNAQIQELSQNKKIGELMSFAHANFDLLDKSSRNLVLSDIKKHLNSITIPEFLYLFPQQKQINSVINLVQRFKNKLEQVPEIIFNPQIYKIGKHLKLQDQALDVANSIAILNEMRPLSSEFLKQIQDQFNDSSQIQDLILNPKTGKKISDLQIQNLMYLKPDHLILQKVLNQDLNKMTIKKILFLSEKVVDQKNSLLKEQLLSQLTKVSGFRYSLEEASQLLSIILKMGWQADSDVTVINLFKTRILLQFASSEELSKLLDFCEKLTRTQPTVMELCRSDLRDLMQSTLNLSKVENIPLQQMVRVATLLIPNVVKPTFLFDVIIKSDENFARDVSEESLELFVKQIQNRLNQQKVTFDHLGTSHSIIHRLFVPYTKNTFQVLNLIISHNVNQNIANSILSDQFVTRKLFPNYESAKSILIPMLEQINQNQVVVNQSNSNKKEVEPDLLKYRNLFLMLKNVCQTLPEEVTFKLSQQIIQKAIMNLKDDIKKTHSIQLHNLCQVNTAFINAIGSQHNNEVQIKLFELYKNQLPLQNIMEETVRFQVKGTINQKITFFEDLKLNTTIKKVITSQTWQQTERLSGDFIQNFLYLIEKNEKTDVKSLFINEYLSRISNSRSLYNENLTNLIKLINKVQIAGDCQQHSLDILMMNICSNLKTIGIDLFNQPKEEENQQNQLFVELNRKEKEKDKELKNMILKMYLQLFQRKPTLFQDKNQFSLSPLSSLMAELFDQFEHQNVLECMQVLGQSEINNYSEDFILKLYENYSQQAFMQKMFSQNPTFFFQFARAWPQFLRNNSILNQLTKVKGKSVVKEQSSPVQDQSETIGILTRRNVLHPDLMDEHFETFIRLKDKATVAKYLNDFLKFAAYFGYIGNAKVEEITQVYRRIYKSPTECKIDELLNYFVFLACSQTYYGDFDPKSILFIESALDIIEEQFTGTEYIIQQRFKDIKEVQTNLSKQNTTEVESQSTVENFKLSYFKQIQTQVKTYGKQAICKQFDEIKDEIEESQNVRESKSPNSSQSEDDEEEITPVMEEIENLIIENEQNDGALELDSIIQTEMNSDNQEKTQQIQRKSYERKGSESQYQEDTEYLQFRNKKLTQLDKKGKHLLMYSNINQLNFVDINQINEAKAWAILFHFRAKSLQSMLFEEFNSISQRNAIGKTKSHQLFNKFYLKMMEQSYNEGLLIQMANSCERTGWPIDISLHTRQSANLNENKNIQPQAIYFLLQEELCYNTKTQLEEPLGLQKLMVKHLQTISDYKVHFVTESEVQNNMEIVIEQLLDKMHPQKQKNAQQKEN